MAAHLSLAAARITDPNGAVVDRAQVLVRGNAMTIRHQGQASVHDGVQSVTQASRGRWVVRFPDGSEWTVERVGRSCCGRR